MNSSCRHHSFLHSFFHSFIPHLSFIHPLGIRLFIPHFMLTHIHSPFCHSFIRPDTHSFIPPLMHPPFIFLSSSMHSFIQSPIHTHTHSFIPPLIHSPFYCSFVPPGIHLFTPPLIHSPFVIHSFPVHFHIHSIPYPIIHSSLQLCIHSSTHSFLPQPVIHSFYHPFTPPAIRSFVSPFIHSPSHSLLSCRPAPLLCRALGQVLGSIGKQSGPRTGIQFPERGGWSDFFLPPFSNNFQKRMRDKT